MHVEIFRRDDGKYAWRVVAANHKVVATDGGQGFERRIDAVNIVRTLFGAGAGMDPVFLEDVETL